VQEGDILLEARGKSLGEPRDLVAVVSEAKDEEFELTLIREGNKQTIRVKPEKRPEGTGGRGPEDVLFGFFGGEEGDQPVRMRFIHPGMFFPPAGLKHELPDDVRVYIVKEGKAAAEVEVRRGDKTWKIKENNLKELPDDLRPHIAAILGHGPMPGGPGGPGGQPFRVRVPRPFEGEGLDDRRPAPAFRGRPGDDRVEDRLEEMNRRLREMREELDRFREDGPRRERPARPRGEDRDPDDRRPEPRRADRPRGEGRGPDADGNEDRPRRRPPRDEDRPGRPPRGEDRRDDDRPGEEA
jgi:hypothetical protein